MSLCQHLESLINGLQGQCAELRRDLLQACSGIEMLRVRASSTEASVQGLQEGVREAGSQIGALRQDCRHQGERLAKVATGVESTRDLASQCKEALKMTGAELKSQRREFEALLVRVDGLQATVEKDVDATAKDLLTEVRQVQLALRSGQMDHERLRAGLQEHREALRSTSNTVQSLAEREEKLEAFAGLLDRRLVDVGIAIKGTRSDISDTNSSVALLTEEHRKTRTQISITADSVKMQVAHMRKAQELLESQGRMIAGARDDVVRTSAGLQGAKEGLEKTNVQLRNLSEAHELLRDTSASLRLQLEGDRVSLQSVKESLRQTNSLVLPNLQLEATVRPSMWLPGHFAKEMSGFTGLTGTTRPPSSRGGSCPGSAHKRDSPPSPKFASPMTLQESTGPPF